VLLQTKYTVLHHENDTDDIVMELNPEAEDKHHSKHWNMMVNQKALEIEHQLQMEENEEKMRERLAEEAKINKARMDKEAAELKLRQ